MEITQQDITIIVGQILVFLVLWIVLKRLWFEPVTAVLRERRSRSEGALVDAEAVTAEAERLRAEHAAALEEAKADAQRAVHEILRGAEAEHKQLVEAATADAERVLEAARVEIAREADEARKSIATEASAIARQVAETLVGRAV